jgi:glycine/D-amino acid oxidase-like deaminating enzyme
MGLSRDALPRRPPWPLLAQPLGSMLIASTRQESEQLAARRERLVAEGLEARLLPADEARRLEPALALGSPDAAALLMPSDLQISGRAAAAALQRACEAHGRRFIRLFGEGAGRLVAGESGRVEAVETEARRWV